MIGYCHLVLEVVYEVYNVGSREPSEAFIEWIGEQSPKLQSTQKTFFFLPKPKYVADGILVVVGHSENPNPDTSASICIFTFSKDPSEQRWKTIKILERVGLSDRAIYMARRRG